MIGFSSYDEVPATGPTTQEILASLTAAQKLAVLDGFALKTPVTQLKHETGVHSFAIRHLYRKIDEIEERSRALMRGEVIVTPGDPPVYNTPPATQTALRNAIAADFSDDFTETQVTAVLTKMVLYSKHDGTGTWTFYKNNVIL
jgi:hypothetical protein